MPAAAHQKIVHPTRHSIYESEADMVAPDTVVRSADVPFVGSSDHFGQPCERSSHLTGDQNASLTLVLHDMVFTRDRSGLSFVLVV